MAVSLGGCQLCSPSCLGKTGVCTNCKWKTHCVFTAVYFTFLLHQRRALERWKRDGISPFLGEQPGGTRGLIDRFSSGKVSVTEAATSQMWPPWPHRQPWGCHSWSLHQSSSFQIAAQPIQLSNPNLLWSCTQPQENLVGEPPSCFTLCNNTGQGLAVDPGKGNAPGLSSCPLSIRTSPALCSL